MKKLMPLFSFLFLFCIYMSSGNSLVAAEFSLNATYKVDTVWATAYQVTVTLDNSTTSPTSSWTATFSMPQGYTLSTYVSSGVFTVNGQNVTVHNLSGKGIIPSKGSTTFTMMIDMPRSAPTIINNLQATANGTAPPPPPPKAPAAPTLNAIEAASAQDYTVSWDSVANATSYSLQQDTTSAFSDPQTVTRGNVLSQAFVGQPVGTYYYRVLATNSSGNSPFSNIESITVTQSPPPVGGAIEHSAWYIDWTSWFTGPTFVLPTDNDVLNVFVGTLAIGSDGTPTLDGFGNFTLPQLAAFTAYCAAQEPPIAVKVSIGGGGGMYDDCWDLLTSENIQSFAQGMVDFCHTYGLIGVDFDYEEYASTDQENLVGMLIKEFKAIDPSLHTSLCTNAGFGPNYPWQNVVQNILDQAMIAPGNCAVDRLYIMSYYDPIEDEENWIIGWANWLESNYGFTPARVSVGIDDFDAHAYDPVAFAAWAASMGFSTAHWAFNPAAP